MMLKNKQTKHPHLIDKDTHRPKVKGQKHKYFYANRKEKKAGVTILLSDKINLRIKKGVKETKKDTT